MTKTDLDKILEKHLLWLNGKDGGERANLTRANLTRANLDFSSWPLWCGSFGVKLDDRLKAQLLYHVIDACGIDNFTDEQLAFANSFHRVGEVPKLKR